MVYRASSLIMLEKWPPWYDILILMFQKEVAERIIAKTQTKEFSRLSVLSNWRLEITLSDSENVNTDTDFAVSYDHSDL